MAVVVVSKLSFSPVIIPFRDNLSPISTSLKFVFFTHPSVEENRA